MTRLDKIIRIALVCAMMTGLFSCKKKEETVTKNYLSGSVTFDTFVPYHTVKNKVDITVSGVSHPAGNRLFCYYSFNDRKDTLWVDNDKSKGMREFKGSESFAITMPENIGDYSLVVHVFPEDSDKYYETSSSALFTVVDPDKSVSGIDFSADASFVDTRDNKKYHYSTVGGVDWMKSNLAYAKLGQCLYSDVMDPLFGRYYTYEEAQKACPQGWSLPGDADFAALANALAAGAQYKAFESFEKAAGEFICKASFNGSILWPYNPVIKISDNPRFAALPAGYMNVMDQDKDSRYHSFRELALFWTADQHPSDASQAMYRVLNLDSDAFMSASADKASMAMSVRCIRK